MTLFLHIGTHKTGTTAIQRFAARHPAALRRRGLWYPLYQDFGLKGHYAHHPLAHALARDDQAAVSDAETFARNVMAAKSPENVLISAEPMYRHLVPREPADYWAGRRAYIERLRPLFPSDDVEILLVVRRQDSFAKSLYQERIKVTRYGLSFREFVDLEPEYFQYQRQLDAFLEFFPRARVLLFEELSTGNLIDAFFAALGVDVADLEHEPLRNVGWPVPLVEYKRALNASPLTDEEVRNVKTIFEGKDLKRWGTAEWWDDAEARAFLARFDADNAKLAERYFPGREGPLFPQLSKAAGPIFSGLSQTEIGEMTALLLQAKPPRPAPAKPGFVKRLVNVVRRRAPRR